MNSKRFAYIFLTFFLLCFSEAQAEYTDLALDGIKNSDEVAAVNARLRSLWLGKLDLQPGDIIPKKDSQYDIGAVGTEWANIYADTVTVNGLDIMSWIAISSLLNGD